MRRTARTTCLLLAFGAGTAPYAAPLSAAEPTPPPATAPKSWELSGRGQWVEATRPAAAAASTTQPVDNPVLDDIERRLARNADPSSAREALVEWLKAPRNAGAPDRDRALYLLADAYYREDDRITAFYHLDELMDTRPESRFFGPALEKQFRIADEYLKGHKRKILGLAVLSADDEAVDMLFRIQERSPGSPVAERALKRTADYYYAAGQFDLAADAYAAYVRSYPRSPDVPRVRLQQAFSSFAQFHGSRFDASPLLDARTQFEDVKVRYPELAEQANVQKFIDTINLTLARKLLVTADFYKRTDKPKAAAYTLLTVLATYPKTAAADDARAGLKQLPGWAVDQAGQVKASEPTSRPAVPLGPERPGGPGELLPKPR